MRPYDIGGGGGGCHVVNYCLEINIKIVILEGWIGTHIAYSVLQAWVTSPCYFLKNIIHYPLFGFNVNNKQINDKSKNTMQRMQNTHRIVHPTTVHINPGF